MTACVLLILLEQLKKETNKYNVGELFSNHVARESFGMYTMQQVVREHTQLQRTWQKSQAST